MDLVEYVDSEFAFEWQRKAAFETRAFAIVSANLALATLFLAVGAQFELLAHLDESPASWLRTVAIVAAAISTSAAVAAAFPGNYSAAPADALLELLDRSPSMKPDDIADQIARSRIAQLAAGEEVKRNKSGVDFCLICCARGGRLRAHGCALAWQLSHQTKPRPAIAAFPCPNSSGPTGRYEGRPVW